MMHFESHRQHRPISLLAAPRNNNKWVLIALGIWFALAIGIFAWFGVQNNQFTSKLQQSKSGLNTAILAAPAKLQAAKATGDAAAMAAVLRELSATVLQNVQSSPQPPSAFGVYIGADAERRNSKQLKTASETYAASLAEVADFIAYQDAIARELQGLGLKDAGGYDQTIALADAWRESAQKIQNEQKPARMSNVIATLVQKMTAAETIIREMAELYKKADSTGFTAKQAQLAAIITEFKVLGEQINAVGSQLDAELASSHKNLRENL